jgi:hypothetical protein
MDHPPNLGLQLKKHQKLQSNKLKFSLKKKNFKQIDKSVYLGQPFISSSLVKYFKSARVGKDHSLRASPMLE